MKTVIIIPARKGSERLPKKNVLDLGGIPLIAHSIEYAMQFAHITTDIYITTDDDIVKSISKTYNVNVIERPKTISGNKATTVSALKHVLRTVKDDFDHVILLQPTNPLRPKKLLAEAFKVFIEKGCDSLMTVSKNEKKLGKINNGNFEPFTYRMGQRSQDLEPLYYENGLLYITKTSLIFDDQILGRHNFPYIVDHPFSEIDIDTKEDLLYAEYMLKNYRNE